jgi:hypothetical protein
MHARRLAAKLVDYDRRAVRLDVTAAAWGFVAAALAFAISSL